MQLPIEKVVLAGKCCSVLALVRVPEVLLYTILGPLVYQDTNSYNGQRTGAD
jgi:hypothetical protein